MSSSNHSSLVVKLAVVVLVAGASIGIFATSIFHHLIYQGQLEESSKQIDQLNQTVSATASIASYLEDEELIKEVIDGLSSNDIVMGASIKTKKLQRSSVEFEVNEFTESFPLYSPFEKVRKVGSLLITPNVEHIKEEAKSISKDNVLALTLEAGAITIVVIILAYFIVTRPIINMAVALHRISPGTSIRLRIPAFHQNSELGKLVLDINRLLDRAEQQLFNERTLRKEVETLEKQFRMLFENSTAATVLMQTNGELILYNEAFTQLIRHLNLIEKENYGEYLKELFEQPDLIEANVCDSFSLDETAVGEYKLSSNRQGHIVWVQAVITLVITKDREVFYQVTLHDISKRKLQMDALDKQANFDQLTGLFNRHAAEAAIDDFIRKSEPFALILLDLNGFKPINDIYGHDAGDDILTFIGKQLKANLRKHDVVSRWGGDEFVIVVPGVNEANLTLLAEKLINGIREPYYLKQAQKEVSVSASMGACFYPEQETHRESLIVNADKAMYQSKQLKDTDPSAYFTIFKKA
jgi:diguanylate cyclase (GGDEF)-like protein/PAS domain S-box-containing protein